MIQAPTKLLYWERLWSPYDASTYDTALDLIASEDVVLDIGAGDLRFSRRVAEKAQRVYVIEQNRSLLPADVPDNLIVLAGDARFALFPEDVTTAVLLMRHCTHFQLYAQKLQAIGCRRLITNARWGMGVECVDLMGERLAFTAVSLGWYACWCGATGFVPGPAEQLDSRVESTILEVSNCPDCLLPKPFNLGEL